MKIILGCRQLQASWRAPCCNGSEILEFSIHVLDDSSGDEIRVIEQEASVCECIIDSLEAGRTYRLTSIFIFLNLFVTIPSISKAKLPIL